MDALKTAQSEMNTIVAKRGVLTAFTNKILLATDRTYKLDREVLVYSEQKKGWLGPSIVVDSFGKLTTVCTAIENVRKSSTLSKINRITSPAKKIYHLTTSSSQSDHSPLFSTLLTETNQLNDSRPWKFDEAKQEEIAGLLKRKTWNVVLPSKVPEDANIL